MPAHRFAPEMVAKLREMAAAGHPGTSIAVALSKMSPLPITPLSVRVKACSLRIRLKRRAAKYGTEVRCPVSLDTWEKLRKMSCSRGLSVSQLAQLFIEIAVDERLVGKIIDDRRPRSRKRRPESVRIGRPRRLTAVVQGRNLRRRLPRLTKPATPPR